MSEAGAAAAVGMRDSGLSYLRGRLPGRQLRMPRPARFAVVGVIGAAANIALLACLVQGFRVEPELANVVQLVVVTQLNFLLSRWWTWRDRMDVSFRRALWRFQVSRIAAATVHQALFVMAVGCGVHYVVAAGFCLVSIAIGNYIVGDLFVFSAPRVGSRAGSAETVKAIGERG